MFEMLQLGFMQRAIICGMIIGFICPVIGIFIVLRKMSLVGECLSHIALSGVIIGVLLGIYPLITSLITSIISSLCIEKLRKSFRQNEELAISIILSGGIGFAVVLIGIAKSVNVDVLGYLFGNITTVSKEDIYTIIVLGVFILVVVNHLYGQLFFIAFDETDARVGGVPVNQINMLFSVIVAITVTISMKVVGILLVSSLIIIPVATSMKIAKTFKNCIALSIVFSQISVVIGMLVSYYFEIAPGGSIVLCSIFLMVSVIIYKNKIIF